MAMGVRLGIDGWKLSEDGDFKVKELSRLIEDKILQVENDAQETLWNKLVPKKVNVFVWRALKGRLPVRVELDRRGIDLDSVLCACCNDSVESCTHCLVTCDLAMSVWIKIFNWWKMGTISVFTIDELFSRNGDINIPASLASVWQAVIWTSGYFIWKERNNRVFCKKVSSANNIVQDIQLKSFEWIVRRSKKYKGIDWQQWLWDPRNIRFSGSAISLCALNMGANNSVQAFGSAMSVFGSVSLQWSGFYWTLVFNTRRPMKFICIRTVWLYASLSSAMSAGDATCLCVQGFVSSANVQAVSLQSSIHTCVFGSADIDRMKKGFLNRREHYGYNHMDANIFNYNNHEEEEEEADDAFGYNLHGLMNDPRGHDPMLRLSRYTDLADFNFFNRFRDDFDDQDFL
ncbi:RNA-directed DNA polymerase, eukaryota, reverse transcriptase zinc-binding domain protein [Tanacetum coccineum]